MITYRNLTEKELYDLRLTSRSVGVDQASYSEIRQTLDGRIVKLFLYDKLYGEFDIADVINDISTIRALSEADFQIADRLALPEEILFYGSEVIGYMMRYIKGTPLSKLNHVKPKQFKHIVSQLLEDVVVINNETGFSFADLHEDNVIIGDDLKIYHIDLDGWYSGGGTGRRSRYISLHEEKLKRIPGKYKVDSSGRIIPDINSDLFCLINIVFNYLIQGDIWFAQMPESEQEWYLKYMEGACNEVQLVNMYKKMLTKDKNYFDINVVNNLPDDIEKYSIHSFYGHSEKFKTAESANLFLIRNEEKLNKLFPGRTH